MRSKLTARKSTGGRPPSVSPHSPYWWSIDSELLKNKRPGEYLMSPSFTRFTQKFRMQIHPGSGPTEPARLSLQLLSKPANLPLRVRVKYSFADWRQYDVEKPSNHSVFEHVFSNDYSEDSAVCAVYPLEGNFDSICCEVEKIDGPIGNPSSASGAPPCKKSLIVRPSTPASFIRATLPGLANNFDRDGRLINYSTQTSSSTTVKQPTVMSNNVISSNIDPDNNRTSTSVLGVNGEQPSSARSSEPDQNRRSMRKVKSITMKLPTSTASLTCFANNNSSTLPSTSAAGSPNKAHLNLSKDVGKLLLNSNYSDIVLVAKNPNDFGYRAHKAIISSRSSVFSELCEKNDKEIILDDISSEILEKLLIFMYSGDVFDLHNCHADVFFAAKKYALVDLMDMCIESMRNNLSSDTAAETLIIAHEQHLEELKAKTMEFMNKNATEVIKTDGYQKILESHKDLVADLYHCLISTSKSFIITD
ncbi:hypothetical protein QAD02_022272 [Eretmocerus hayati]|uniref:Uncharacterized protein n=1 Tax=Eretmocerus hayati TaxID=131215 RepID=A0ACC2PTP4_9HYME|nr:hypothetical protein QAD02_022272 [Eretmocerus hayati]